jgi:glycosyltransferase involved in cell wall biosynthesis
VATSVLILSPNYPPEQGACASRIRYMAQGLAEAGYEVEVLTAMPNYPKGKIFRKFRNKLFFKQIDDDVVVKRYLVYASHSAHLLPRLLSMFSLSFAVLFHVFSAKKGKPSLVIAQSPPLLLALSAYWLSKVYKADFILNVSDLWPRALLDLGAIRKGWGYKLASGVEQFLYRKAKLCIGQSKEILAHIEAHAPQTPSFLYRTGVDCELFMPQDRHTPPVAYPFRMVYAGLLGIAQAILSICENVNFNELGTELHIYGDGYERKPLEKYLRKNPNLGIYLHDSVPHIQVPAILQGYDAVLVTQKNIVLGTVPSKIYEAMAMGLPILFCGGGEGAEIILENQVGLVSPPRDFNLLKNNILEIKKLSLGQKQEISARGRKVALRELDRGLLIRQLIAILGEVKG